ncbi:MAG TPA: GNAT family N-acetyltransferase [Bacillales bacterium]|nr:GNAT family N-acetyltransferase [Bacillales bacterium]
MDRDLFHSLKGEQIRFQALSVDDAEAIHAYASNAEVSRFIGWNLMQALEDTRNFIQAMIKRESEGSHLYASIVKESTGEIVGTVMFFNFDREAKKAEVGYVLHQDHWGKGYGTEAVALMTRFGFESSKLHKLHAGVVDVNVGSARILEKNSYELEGRLKDHYFIEGRYYDALLYGKIQKRGNVS